MFIVYIFVVPSFSSGVTMVFLNPQTQGEIENRVDNL